MAGSHPLNKPNNDSNKHPKTHNHFVLCNFPSRNYRHSIIFSKTRFPAPALPASMIPHGYWRAFCSSSSDSGGPNRHLQAAAGKHFRRLAGESHVRLSAPQGKKPAVPRSLFHIYNYFSPYYKKSYRRKNGTWNGPYLCLNRRRDTAQMPMSPCRIEYIKLSLIR